MISQRAFLGLAGLCGASGVGLSALAAHGAGPNAATAAAFLLAHAPAFLAVGLLGDIRVVRWATALIGLGVVLFSGDLVCRDFLGTRLLPMAAPAGGTLVIAGWLGVALAAVLPRKSGKSLR